MPIMSRNGDRRWAVSRRGGVELVSTPINRGTKASFRKGLPRVRHGIGVRLRRRVKSSVSPWPEHTEYLIRQYWAPNGRSAALISLMCCDDVKTGIPIQGLSLT